MPVIAEPIIDRLRRRSQEEFGPFEVKRFSDTPYSLSSLISMHGPPRLLVTGEGNHTIYDETVERKLWDSLQPEKTENGTLRVVIGPIIGIPNVYRGLRWCQTIFGSLSHHEGVEIYVSKCRQPFHYSIFGSNTMAYCENPHLPLQEERSGWVNRDNESIGELESYFSKTITNGDANRSTLYWNDFVFLTETEIKKLVEAVHEKLDRLEKEEVIQELERFHILPNYHRVIKRDYWSQWEEVPMRPIPDVETRCRQRLACFGLPSLDGITKYYDEEDDFLDGA